MQKNKNFQIVDDLRFNLATISGISLGVFLFLLFFQPLQIVSRDFNAKLLILATFGAITLLLLAIFRIAIPLIFKKAFSPQRWNVSKEILIDILFVASNSVAFVFFGKYVGKVAMTFYPVIIIVIISIVAVVVILTRNQIRYLKNQLQKFEESIAPKTPELKPENKTVVFRSDNKTDFFRLQIHQIIVIKSASNYIEVFYDEDGRISKKLLRTTLKNTEELFSGFPEIVRCHRSCMVNKNYILKANKDTDGLILTIQNYPEKVHVSRQYILTVKEALAKS